MSKRKAIAPPEWIDGLPANFTAAALDALEWLQWLDRAAYKGLKMGNEDRERLGRCIAEMEKRLHPHANEK